MRAFQKLYVANLREFIRDRMAIFWTIAFPVVFIIVFGAVFSNNDDTNFGIGLAVQDQGAVGQALQQAYLATPALHITTGSPDGLIAKLKKGDLRMVIVVPDGSTAAVQSGQEAPIEAYYDPANQTSAQVALTIAEKVMNAVDQQLTQRPTLLTLIPRIVTQKELRFIDYVLPGILAMSLMQLGLFATAPALVQLREQQVLRRFGATPLPRTTLLAAQVVHRLTIGLTQTVIIIVVGAAAFGVHITGNLFALAGVVLLGATMMVSLGYLISGVSKTQESVVGLTQLINFPMMLLSGIFFSVDMMPTWARPIVSLMPLSYLGDALRQIMVGATPVFPLRTDILVLGGWLIVGSILAVRFFRWE
jgi:ABC-2 type transport system permease protein